MPTSVEHLIALVTKLEDQASPGFDNMARSAERAAQRVDRAQQQTQVAVDKTERQVQQAANTAQRAEQQVEDLGDASNAAIGKAAMIAGAIGGVVGALAGQAIKYAIDNVGQMIASFFSLARSASELKTFAASIGTTTDEAQRFGYVAERFNVPITAVAGSSRMLAKAIAENSPVLRDLGISTRDASGKLRTTHDVTLDLAEVFAGTTDETAKLTVVTKLMGEQGRMLLPVLNQGAEALGKVEDAAASTGRTLDEDTIASLTRFDSMMRTIADKWNGFTIKVRVAIIRSTQGPSTETPASVLQDINWWQLQAQAAAKLFPDRFSWNATLREATGSLGGLSDADRLRVNAEASRMLTEQENERAAAEAAAAKATQDAADKVDKATAAAKRFESQLEALQSKLSSRELTSGQVDALAAAFNRGDESVRSLLAKLETPEAVTRVIDRARLLVALVEKYGDAWQAADLLTRRQTDHLSGTEEKMRAVRVEMEKLLAATNSWDTTLKRRGFGTDKRATFPNLQPDGTVPVTPAQQPQGSVVPPEVFDWLNTNSKHIGADAVIGVLERIDGQVDKSVERWTQRFVQFRGFWGDLMQFIVAEAIKAFMRILEMQVVTGVLNLFAGGAAGGAGGGGSITSFSSVPTGTGPGVGPLALAPAGGAGVPRGTTVVLNVNALDLGTVADRTRSPFGAIRLALEDALDAGGA